FSNGLKWTREGGPPSNTGESLTVGNFGGFLGFGGGYYSQPTSANSSSSNAPPPPGDITALDANGNPIGSIGRGITVTGKELPDPQYGTLMFQQFLSQTALTGLRPLNSVDRWDPYAGEFSLGGSVDIGIYSGAMGVGWGGGGAPNLWVKYL